MAGLEDLSSARRSKTPSIALDAETNSANTPLVASPSHIHCLSNIYSTAIAKAWAQEAAAAETLDGAVTVSEQKMSLLESTITEEICAALMRIDEDVAMHDVDVGFSGLKDDWGTDMWITSFHRKWQILKSALITAESSGSITHPSTPPTTSPHDAYTPADSTAKPDVTSPARTHILALATHYTTSHAGADNTASNGTLHGHIRDLRNNRLLCDAGSLDEVYAQLIFRISLSRLATRLLVAAGIRLPANLPCGEWDQRVFEREVAQDPQRVFARKYTQAKARVYANVLPTPCTPFHGLSWVKPKRYVAAGIALDGRIEGEGGLEEAVGRLEDAAKQDLERVRRGVEGFESVRDLKRGVFARVGRRVPDKGVGGVGGCSEG